MFYMATHYTGVNVYNVTDNYTIGQNNQENFFLGGRMGGGRRADKKRRKNFVLGPPYSDTHFVFVFLWTCASMLFFFVFFQVGRKRRPLLYYSLLRATSILLNMGGRGKKIETPQKDQRRKKAENYRKRPKRPDKKYKKVTNILRWQHDCFFFFYSLSSLLRELGSLC